MQKLSAAAFDYAQAAGKKRITKSISPGTDLTPLPERSRRQWQPGTEEKHMFGGIAFMVDDKMCVGIIKDEMMCRIDPELHDQCVEMAGCRTMDFNKRPMKGFVMIDRSIYSYRNLQGIT